MKENLTELGVVIDRSGSMDKVRDDAIGGFNAFLKSQQELPGDANMTVVLFDTTVETYAVGPVKGVAPLSQESYKPDGWTALYDAVGKTIDDIGKKLANMREEDRPSKVIIAILTDGAENSSKKYTQQDVFNKIKVQRDTYNWEFIFLAAGEAAFQEGEAIGMTRSKMAKFTNDAKGNAAAYDALCCYSSALRSADSSGYEALKCSVNIQELVDQKS